MRFKDVFMLALFALSVSFLFQYMFFKPNKPVEETSFVAPKERKEYRPLNLEVDSVDRKSTLPVVITDIETEWAFLNFSTYGAALESIDCKRDVDGKVKTIRTIFPVADSQQKERCFLVALEHDTPMFYRLSSFDDFDGTYVVRYVAENSACTIHKTFFVDKKKPVINLKLELAPKDINNDCRARVFYPAPLMPDLKSNDIVSTCIVDKSDEFLRKQMSQIDFQQGWFAPKVFGIDNRYFIHSLINDSHNFVERAYYKTQNCSQMFSILEGPRVSGAASWELSFYFGPKDLDCLQEVGHSLEKTLEYSGWFAPIAKFILYMLRWFYKYLHNYGLAIAALAVLFHLLMLPVMLRHNEDKLKKQQAEYQKKLAALKVRFANEPDKLAVEQAELIKKEGMPGLGFLLVLFLQIPPFFALRNVLSSSFELYQAPMLWIPDLSATDPYYILSILLVIVMIMQDVKVDPQQRMNKFLMAIVFGAITTTCAAGLTLYILLGRVLGLLQSRIMKYFKMV